MKLKNLLLFVFSFSSVAMGQSQQKIDWPSLADSPWPILKGDMQGTARSEFLGPSTPNIIWEADMSLGIYLGPTIGYDDILYFGTHSIDPDFRNDFYAYYPDGTEYWRYETHTGYPNSLSPLIRRDSSVLMGSNIVDMYAFTYDGDLNWRIRAGDGYAGEFTLSKDGNIYSYTNDTLRAFDAKGSRILNKPFPWIIGNITFAPDGQTFYTKTGINGSDLYALDLDGEIRWVRRMRTNRGRTPVDNEGNLYVFGRDSLTNKKYMYSLYANGEKRWESEVRSFFEFHSPAIDFDGNIIFAAGFGLNFDSYLVSLDYEGNDNWKVLIDSTSDLLYPDEGPVVDAEGKIYLGSSNYGGDFYCFNSGGELLWKIPLNGNAFDSAPAIGSDGTLYIGTHIGVLNYGAKKTLIAIRDEPNSIEEKLFINEFKLFPNYPNPFNPTTKIKYTIPKIENRKSVIAQLKIYDILGNEIATLVNEPKPVGTYEVEFDGTELSSGVYIYRITSTGFSESNKMLLLK